MQSEVVILHQAAEETVSLMHSTRTVPAIKLLVSAHDILTFNLEITKYPSLGGAVPWDRSALFELDRLRCEVLLRYGESFNPLMILSSWYQTIGSLFRLLNVSSMSS